MPINPLNPSEELQLVEPPSLLGRVGEQAANFIPDIGNDMTRLLFNLGLQDKSQTKPFEFSKPYDIPAPRNFNEGAVDVVSSLARAVPLIMTGEGAGAGLAEAAGAGRVASRIIGSATGFGLQGETESTTQGSLDATLGAGFGAAQVLPRRYRLPLALGIGALTGAESYAHTEDPVKALAMGTVNAVLPFVLKGRTGDKKFPEVPSGAPPALPFELERQAASPSTFLQTEKGLVKNPAFFKEPVFTDEQSFIRNGNGAIEPPSFNDRLLPFERPSGPPEGSLIREPAFTQTEMRRAAGVEPPPGSLIRNPALTEREALAIAEGKGNRAIKDFFAETRPPTEPIPPRAPIPPAPPTPPRSPIAPRPASAEVATLQPNKPILFNGKQYASMEEAQAALTSTIAKAEADKQAARTTALTVDKTINPKRRLAASTVMHVDDTSMAKVAADKLGVEYQGVGLADTDFPLLEFKDPIHNGNISVPSGTSFKDFKAMVEGKRAEFDAGAKVKDAAKESTTAPAELPSASEQIKFPFDKFTTGEIIPVKLETKVATLQSPPFSLEKPMAGDHVLVDVTGEGKERGIIVGHDETAGTTQVKIGDDVHDVWTSKLEAAPKPTGEAAEAWNNVQTAGGAADLAKLEGKPAGMKLRQRLGEIGTTQQDIINSFARYVAAPIVGATVGAAISDPDKRTQNAILFALGALGLGHISPRLIEAFANSHPDIAKAGSFANTVKEFGKAAAEAATASERATAKAAVETGSATGFEKVARWLNRRFTTAPTVQKALDKAHGLVDEISKVIEKGQLALADAKLSAGQLSAIQAYFSGKITQTHFDRLLGDPKIYQAATAIRESANTLQQMIYKSLPEGELKTAVKDSFNKYITETFKIFHDPAYYPTEETIQKVARELPGGSLENNTSILKAYLNQIQANKGVYGINRKGQGYGQALGAVLSRKDPELSQAFKEMLGIYDSPLAQMAATSDKLVRGARTAEYFNQLADTTKPNGLKMSYGYEEIAATRETISHQLEIAKQNGNGQAVATLQSQLSDLNNYLYNEANSQHGKLSAAFVDRRVHDSLMTYDSILTTSASPINQAMTDVTNAVKYAHTVASPLQFTRQVFSMPFLGVLAKTGPADWLRAYNSLFHNPAELSRLRKLGLTYGDTVSGMLRQDFSEMLKGKFDNLVTNRTIRKGISTWEEIYRTPDLITRIAAFQAQEQRLLRQGLSAEDATDKAIDFANRYAMNYGMAPKGIQVIRKIPFVNQYLTFAFEIARITKNLAEDAIKNKDPYAIGVLTAMATAPLLVQKLTESQLSPKDLEDWKKAEALLPDYSRSNFKFVTNRDSRGNFHYVDFTPIIVHDRWMKMARDIGNLDWNAFKADNPLFGWENTPLLNVATNQMTGVDQHTKENLSTIGQRIDSIRRDILPPLLGTDLDKILKALTPNERGSLGITDLRTGNTASIGSIIGSYATSLRSYTVSPTNLEQRAIADATTQTANARAYAYRIARSDAAPDVKEAARAYYLTVQKQILLSLRDKLRKSTPPTQVE